MKFRKSIFFIFFSFLIIFIALHQENIKASEINYIEGSEYSVNQVITLNNKKYLAVATGRFLYFMEDQELKSSIKLDHAVLFLDVIDDSNNNGYEEILVITNSTTKDNILVFDSKDYELLWSKSFTMDAYTEGKGTYKQIIEVEDYLLDDNKIIFIAGYETRAYSLSGKLLWKYKADNNLWAIENVGDINKDGVNDFVVAKQWSTIIALSGKSGNKIYQKITTEKINSRYYQKIMSNIWDLDYDKASNILYVVGEDGYLYRVNPGNGKTIDKKEIFTLTQQYLENYYEPSGRRDSRYFKNFRVELIDDINDDGVKDLLYYQNIKKHGDYYDNNNSKIIALSGHNLEKIYELDVSMTGEGFLYFKGYYQNQAVLYKVFTTDTNGLTYNMFSMKDGSKLETSVYIPIVIEVFNPYSPPQFIQNDSEQLILLNETGIQFISLKAKEENVYEGNIENVILSGYKTDLLIDGNNTIYLKTPYSSSNNKNNQYFYLESRGWKYELSYDDFKLSNGFTIVDYKTDINKDGVNDFVLLLNLKETSSLNNKLPIVLTLDGKTGSELSRVSIGIPEADLNLETSYDQFLNDYGYYILGVGEISKFGNLDDINHDGIKDYYFVKRNGDIYFYDLKNNNLLNYYVVGNSELPLKDLNHVNNLNFNEVYYMNDINQDGYRDFVYIEENIISLLQTTIENGMITIDFNHKTELDQLNGDFLSNDLYKNITREDVDGDGIEDVALVSSASNSEKYYLNIISSKTGENLTNLNHTRFDNYMISPVDVDGDGYNELVNFILDDVYNIQIQIINMKTKEVLFRTSMFRGMGYNGTTNYSDFYTLFEENNEKYIALYVNENDNYAIEVYNIKTHKIIRKEVVKPRITEYFRRVMELQPIRSFEYEKDIHFYVDFRNELYNYDKNTDRTYVYNFTQDKHLFTYKGHIQKVYDNNQMVIYNSYLDQMIPINIDYRAEITNLSDEEKIKNNFNLKFNNEANKMVYIYVDDELVGSTDDDHFQLDLLRGEHAIKILMVDENGIETQDTVFVTVPRRYVLSTIIITTTIMILLATIILPLKKKRFEREETLEEGSDGDE